MRQRTDASTGGAQDAILPARRDAGNTVQEIEMSKGNRGNKEAKKPKQVTPVVKSPVMGSEAPTPPSGAKALPRKK